MKKITKIFAGMTFVALAFAAVSCTDREQASYGEGTQLADATITVLDAQYNSLTFKWEPVTGAIEYGYKLTDEDNKLIDGGVTKLDSVTFEGLDYLSKYTIHVYAYPSVVGDKIASKESTLTTSTPFYPAVDASGTFTSNVVSGTNSWTASIIEERAEGEDQWYGTFTLQAWYNHEDYDLQFTVNADSTINVLNGTRDSDRVVTVGAGPNNIRTNIYVRYGVQLNEKLARFDRENHTLTLYARSKRPTGTNKEGYETYTWE